ncbi:unnamed protein product [Miscanthus lutarioriparius]|uniref:Uncharacterized protein n=1 Tax=Miscanthus lutarioriparius TaxID=422564 RepID=A0A811MTW0_9POAL|nr:unnamed protein product [Miscanthus lutarioriparius]CAD6341531.1 unnamed protein product [Miscanthus lutarioriparius]
MEKIRSAGLLRTQGLIAGKWVDAYDGKTITKHLYDFENELFLLFGLHTEIFVSICHELMDCLNWRVQNEIDSVLAKPILPSDLYRAIRDTLLVGLTGYSKQGQPVYAFGVGLSTFDKASVAKLSLEKELKLLI